MKVLYCSTLFLSAWLIFSVQPMIAKQLLPDRGGAPIVWNTCLASFQVLLLGGYFYAHFLRQSLKVISQMRLHLVFLFVPVFAIMISLLIAGHPFAAASSIHEWSVNDSHPVIGLLMFVLATIGVPFLLLSSSAPLLQHWYAQGEPGKTTDPYFLYAASNAGSLIGLLSYPVLERYLDLREQSGLWSTGFFLIPILILICAVVSRRRTNANGGRQTHESKVDTASNEDRASEEDSIGFPRRLRWMLLAAAPSSLLVSVTNYLTTDVAAIPLFWVIPLAVYLVTYILTFASRTIIPHWIVLRYFPMVLILWCVTRVLGATEPASVLFGVHLITFFAASIACHGELYRSRPSPGRLTGFYLCLASGGAMGTLFAALLAPLLFETYFEYPSVLVGAYAIISIRFPNKNKTNETGKKYRPGIRGTLEDLGFALIAGTFVIGTSWILDRSGFDTSRSLDDIHTRYARGFFFSIPLVLLGVWSTRPPRFILGLLAVLFGAHLSQTSGDLVHAERTWFGVHRVLWDSDHRFHELRHGTTVHGRQRWPPNPEVPPGSYYHPNGPLGDIFRIQKESGSYKKIAVAGLGSGSIAYYGRDRPSQYWTFIEIDPAVIHIAEDDRLFTFLTDAFPDPSRLNVVVGDARVKLKREGNASFDLIVIDVFSSDSIPVHLMTQEAFEIYLNKLSDRGILLFHISNRHLDFRGLLATLAARHSPPLACVGRDDLVGARTAIEVEAGKMASQWVAIARHPNHLAPLIRQRGGWKPYRPPRNLRPWTDQYADLFSIWKAD